VHVTPESTVAADALAAPLPSGFEVAVSFSLEPVACPMRAVVRRSTKLIAKEIADPVPGSGQVLLRTLACGICGSDLHALVHAERRRELALRAGFANTMDPGRDVVFGHEFCGEIVGYGPDTRRDLAIGTRVVSMPLARGPGGIETIGFSNNFSGGFAERLIATEELLNVVPDDVSDDQASMTEPFAVGLHAVNAADADEDAGFLVVGCGPVGLAVITALRLRGHTRIAASDFSPMRRRVARQLGASVVIDPLQRPAESCWAELGVAMRPAPPFPRSGVNKRARRAIVFECVGVPGVIQKLIETSPVGSRIVVVGSCQEQDAIEPWIAISRQIEMRFVVGYTYEEFSETLAAIAQRRINLAPVITGRVGLDGVAAAFERLANPEADVKIVVCPALLDLPHPSGDH
jgi:threonine dehydrogenase-like Zn-dependent dehydrogenase